MISYILLRDWRGYQKFALGPEPGLTFIVAENGTGKTSLLQAASWTLFGAESGVDPSEMLRAGQPELAVQLAAEVGDEVLTVRRGWSPASRPRESFVANGDGESLREDDVRVLWRSEFHRGSLGPHTSSIGRAAAGGAHRDDVDRRRDRDPARGT